MNSIRKLQFLAALALACAAFSASAADNKGISTLECRPYSAAHTGLNFTVNGITNTTTASRSVLCPILRDQNVAYTAALNAFVSPWFRTGAAAGTLRCTVYRGSAVSALAATSVASPLIAPNTNSVISINVVSLPPGWVQIQMNLLCTLSPGVTMAHIYLNENGPTQ
ncbi:hypothetical protein [Montanilutibacter psychrotolerans]|uniref:Spore coat protein U domain-containing protein n=1 Tax=Montanilutibacter psychrotolerans TaxID=1327343 RepID=A0A3M8SQ51_9GAMM|nr:hypothetical protein [Lysobacter psychrotolerans]RNF82825.1 hypothetical protein EER27_13010 [Lysobacter psychrotolerans]